MIASNQTFIVAAYALTWVVLLVYLARLIRMSARGRREYLRVTRAQSEGRQA